MLYFVYELFDPREDLPFYVGITIDPNTRLKDHLAHYGNNEIKVAHVARLRQLKMEPRMQIRDIVTSEHEARQKEKEYIRAYEEQGVSLTNIVWTKPKVDRKEKEKVAPPIQQITPPPKSVFIPVPEVQGRIIEQQPMIGFGVRYFVVYDD